MGGRQEGQQPKVLPLQHSVDAECFMCGKMPEMGRIRILNGKNILTCFPLRRWQGNQSLAQSIALNSSYGASEFCSHHSSIGNGVLPTQ